MTRPIDEAGFESRIEHANPTILHPSIKSFAPLS